MRLSELAPGIVGLVEDGGAGVEVLTVAASGEDPLTGVLGAAKVLVVDAQSALEVVVSGPDGGVCPTTRSCPKVDEILLEGSLSAA